MSAADLEKLSLAEKGTESAPSTIPLSSSASASAPASGKVGGGEGTAIAGQESTIFQQVMESGDVERIKQFIIMKQHEKEYEKALASQEKRKLKELKANASEHKFWDTQPISKDTVTSVNEPMDGNTDIGRVRKEPLKLPGFEWVEIDVNNPTELQELYALLSANYVEDDEAMFRFDYSKEFLMWALTVPGYRKDWHVGVRSIGKDGKKGKLYASITAVPAEVSVHGSAHIPMVEINFLCVHKSLRDKRLAPVLIQEVTRRVNLTGRWQAVYTAGVVLPGCKARCRYWHRNISVKKLCDVKFSYLPTGKTMKAHCDYLAIPDNTSRRWRVMLPADVPEVTAMLNGYLRTVKISQIFSEADVFHLMLPRAGVVNSYVLDGEEAAAVTAGAGAAAAGAAAAADGAPKKVITDFGSFYHLPSSIIKNPNYDKLYAAYCYYNVANTMSMTALMGDLLVLAKKAGADVFNALDLMKNGETFESQKFGKGDGNLQYYIYNWKCDAVEAGDVGLVLV